MAKVEKMPKVEKVKPKRISGFLGESAGKSSLKIDGKEVQGAMLIYITDMATVCAPVGDNIMAIKGLAWETFINHAPFKDIRKILKIEF